MDDDPAPDQDGARTVREIPGQALNPEAPSGTAPARVAHKGPFWCRHSIRHEYNAREGYYFVDGNAADDELHPKDAPIIGPGVLSEACQPATGFDPGEYPNAGPGALQRAYLEVLRERRRRA